MSYEPTSHTVKRVHAGIIFLVLLGAIGLGYHHTLHSPFLLDDGVNIVQNPYIQIDSLSLESLKKVFSPYQPSYTRPVANLSFALNYFLAGYDPVGFHLVNILIHVFTSFILFRLFFFYFLKTDIGYNDALKLAAFAALLWAVNPLQTSAVTYIVQRMTSLCTLFVSAALLSYVHARSLQSPDRNDEPGQYKAAAYLLLSVLLWLLAMMTKEIAAIMPILVILHEVFFFRGFSRRAAGKYTYVYCALFFVSLLLYMLFFVGDGSLQWMLNGYLSRDFSLGERLLTEGRVVARYMSLFLLPLPSRLTLYYDFPISSSLTDPVSTLWSFLLLLILFVFALGWGKRYRLLSFGILWSLSCLVIESTVLPLELIYEHRFYLPSIGFSLAVVVLSYHLFNAFFSTKKVFTVFWLLLLSIMLSMTYMRNQDWQSELSLNLDGAEKAPQLLRAVNNLAGSYIRSGANQKGMATLERALQLDPDNVVVLANLFMLSADLKMSAQAGHYLKRMNVAISSGHFRCNQSPSLLLASEVLVTNGRFPDAIFLLENLKQCRAKNAVYYDNLALCYAQTGNQRKAIENFKTALEVDPGNPYYLFSLVRSYLANKEKEKAQLVFEKLRITSVPDELKPHVDKLEKYFLRLHRSP